MSSHITLRLARAYAAAGVIVGFVVCAACSAPAVVDPNKAERDRAEMRAREKKETRALNRSIDKVEREREEGEEY